MKNKIIALLLFLFSLTVYAQQVNTDIAINISTKYMGSIRRNTPELSHVEFKTINNHICLYEVVFNDSSWCIVPADMRVDPILAFGFERTNIDDLPEAFVKLIEWYKAQLDTIIYSTIDTTEAHPLWARLLDNRYSENYNIGDSLLDMTGRGNLCWKQGKNNDGGCSPSYNQDCPSTLIDCYKCYHEPVGCAAVALGEIMWYWRWPESSEYDWEGMPSKLINSTSPESASKVTRFLRECGESVNMTYACTGSFATMDNIVSALTDRYNYKSSHKIYKSDWEYGSAWNNLIKSEIDNKRPVLFYGDSWSFFEGHFFVVDGYIENNGSFLYHVNWGHGGGNNCFCRLDRFKEIIHNGNSINTNYYDINNRAIVGIAPTYSIKNNITGVYYSRIPDGYTRNEYAKNSVALPSSGHTFTVEYGGNLVIEAGNEVILQDGFEAKRGSEVTVNINQEWLNGMAISVPYWPNVANNNGYYINQRNADSWEFSLLNTYNDVVFQSAGSINSDYVCLWDGHGLSTGAYLGIITLKNSYGRSLHQELSITILNRGDTNNSIASTNLGTIDNYTNSIDMATKQNTSSELRAFPNPSTGLFSIETVTDSIISVNVYNAMGQHVYTDDNIISQRYSLNMMTYPKGNYIIAIQSKKQLYFEKIIIK